MANKSLIKVAVTALVAGLIGGGVAYGGITYFQNNNIATSSTSVPTGSNKSGSTSTTNVKVNVSSQATKVFQNNKAAVVSVINLQKQSSTSGWSGILGGDDSSGSDSSLSSDSSSSKLEEYSEGSGLIYKKSGSAAYIVTNNHVVSGSNAIRVILSNGTKLTAKIVGTDSVTDLAVLKINSSKVTKTASFGNSDNIKVGETALAIGSPMGSNYATTLTEGIISAKKRTVATTNTSGQTTGYATVIQTDAAINSGNSGGPLFNIAGQVIGINSMKLASDNSGTSVEGMGFAIPSNEVVKIINELVKNGEVVRPALGVATYNVANISASDRSSVLKLPSSVKKGVVIMKTYSGSPAKTAGLTKYDVITELGGKKVTNLATLRSALYAHSVNDTVTVKYYHDGKLKTTSMKLTETTKTLNKQSN
ncbi:S1C family serine protease [Lactiplantibacillus pentosus]|uniref:S1C family serine protease n=1 Tax=Lactiplantibacillus pentosus TaxID=1589 RepID=UPI001C1FCCF8|nr:trypsin-like peptidase domain-containing protein [Lactiplantibacillus pentosus]MBU7504099.1 trypsin-like peptidase domain-containing protein [Lactiplantibacillus pentosus]MDY1543546.1 trypsin-like peptidase domain-containing protein [Lactiplantibacillus pentosus]